MGKYIIGIDLGTTKSAVAIYEAGVPKIIPNTQDKRTTPSVVALKKTGDWIVGDGAKNQAATNPLKTLYGVKRLIGRRFSEDEVKKMASLASYKIVQGPNGDAWVEVDGKAMAPAEISAKVLRELKDAAEKYLGKDKDGNQIVVSDAVITVPAYFNDSQRQATRDAGEIAGLNVLRIVNEPTAAALAYGLDKKKGGKFIVYDLGGGTFDVSLLEVVVDANGGTLVEVKSTCGDTFLGGENFDERIVDYLAGVLKQETGLDPKGIKDLQVLQRLKDAAEKAKIELSKQETSEINLPFLGQVDGEMVNFEHTLTRGKLEELVQDLIDKTKEPCRQALAQAGLTVSDVDEVILVGAQTLMPKVVETVRAMFGGKEPRMDVPVQEIVAMGASVQAAVLEGKLDNIILMDVIPLSIGIRVATPPDMKKAFPDGMLEKMIERNSPIPAEKTETFSTAEDDQEDVHIKVYQGERDDVRQDKLLGTFTLTDLPPGPKGMVKIDVTFKIDANGVLCVEAKDQKTGRAQQITIQANGGLSEADIKRMVSDAEKNAENDRIIKERLAAGAIADELLKKAAKDENQEFFLKAPADMQQAFRDTVRELTEARGKKDAVVMVEKNKKLQEIRSAMGKAFYEAGQDTPPATEEVPKPDTAAKEPPEGPAL